jgi:hypothetical protein
MERSMTAPAMAVAAVGDVASWATFLVLGAGQVVTWVLMGRAGGRNAVRRGEAAARGAAEQAAAVKELAAANARIAEALESLDAWARSHELADARWQAAMAETQRQTAEALTRLTDMQASLQGQLTDVALRLAPASGGARRAARL